MKREIIDLFSELISYETTSDSESGKFPSTDTQISFGKILEVKLKEIGLENVNVDKYGYVTGELPTNCGDETAIWKLQLALFLIWIQVQIAVVRI